MKRHDNKWKSEEASQATKIDYYVAHVLNMAWMKPELQSGILYRSQRTSVGNQEGQEEIDKEQ